MQTTTTSTDETLGEHADELNKLKGENEDEDVCTLLNVNGDCLDHLEYDKGKDISLANIFNSVFKGIKLSTSTAVTYPRTSLKIVKSLARQKWSKAQLQKSSTHASRTTRSEETESSSVDAAELAAGQSQRTCPCALRR